MAKASSGGRLSGVSWCAGLLLFSVSYGCYGHSDGPGAENNGDSADSSGNASGGATSRGATSSGAGVDGTTAPTDDRSIWTPMSASIEVHKISYWTGSLKWQRRAEQLSPHELELVQALQLIPLGGGCASDNDEIYVTIVDATGDVREYWAAGRDDHCGGVALPTIAYGGVQAVLTNAGCLGSREPSGEASLPLLVPGSGCLHGAQFGTAYELDVEPGARYRVRAEDCVSEHQVSLAIVDAEDAPLASSVGSSEVCPTLEFTANNSGKGFLRVDGVPVSGTTPVYFAFDRLD